jgi:DNA-binding beta-propeller fold protein YncE
MATGLADWQEDTGLPNLKGVAASPDGTRVYASSSGPNRIIEIDATDGTVLATGDLGGEPRVEPLPTKKGDCVYLQNEVTGMQCFDPNDIAGGAVWTSLVSGEWATGLVPFVFFISIYSISMI